jgi:hypothetical protein
MECEPFFSKAFGNQQSLITSGDNTMATLLEAIKRLENVRRFLNHQALIDTTRLEDGDTYTTLASYARLLNEWEPAVDESIGPFKPVTPKVSLSPFEVSHTTCTGNTRISLISRMDRQGEEQWAVSVQRCATWAPCLYSGYSQEKIQSLPNFRRKGEDCQITPSEWEEETWTKGLGYFTDIRLAADLLDQWYYFNYMHTFDDEQLKRLSLETFELAHVATMVALADADAHPITKMIARFWAHFSPTLFVLPGAARVVAGKKPVAT